MCVQEVTIPCVCIKSSDLDTFTADSLVSLKFSPEVSSPTTTTTSRGRSGGGGGGSGSGGGVPAPSITPMRGWHMKQAEGEDGKALSYEEQVAAQAKAARTKRKGRRRRRGAPAPEPEPEPEPEELEYMGEID